MDSGIALLMLMSSYLPSENDIVGVSNQNS